MEAAAKPIRKKQVVLRATHLDTAVGAELCQLLATTSDDGRVEMSEASALADWLIANQGSGLPAIDHLLPLIQRIMLDGVVTRLEEAALQAEIERVLPPELRSVAKLARRQAMEADRARLQQEEEAARAAKDAERLKALEERKRNGPVAMIDFCLAGVNYEGRGDYIDSRLNELADLPLTFSLEPNNPFDRYAVAVLLDGYKIGYVPRGDAREIHELLATGHRYRIRVKTTIGGRAHTIPIIDGEIFSPESTEGSYSRSNEQLSSANVLDYKATDNSISAVLAGLIAIAVAVWVLLVLLN